MVSLGSRSFFVGQMKTAASLLFQQRRSLVHLDLNPVEKLVVERCLTFFAGVLWTQTCMSSKIFMPAQLRYEIFRSSTIKQP